MAFVIILVIFLVPIASIICIPGTCVWFPQLLALELFGGVCFASMFWELNRFLALFLAYLVFSYVIVSDTNMHTMMCLLIGYMAISVTLAVSKIKDLKWIYVAIIGMTLLNLVYVILQVFGIDPIFYSLSGNPHELVGFMGTRNELEIYAASTAFFAPWLIPLALVPILMAKQLMGLAGLFAGGVFYVLFLHSQKAFNIFLLIAILIAVPLWHVSHKRPCEFIQRLKMWRLSVNQLIDGKTIDIDSNGKKTVYSANCLTGFGLGGFLEYSPLSQFKIWGLERTDKRFEPTFMEHDHNDLVEALYEFGYIGFFLIIGIIFSVVCEFIYSPKTFGVVSTFSSLVAQSMCAMGVYVFHAPVSLFMFCLTLGLFYAEVNREKQSTIKPITT